MNKKRVVFNGGVYDLCHQGHINLLKKMRQRADILVVSVADDRLVYKTKGRIPIQNTERRIENLKITGLVDQITVIKTLDNMKEYGKLYKKYKNHSITYMRGDDDKNFPAKNFMDAHNIPIILFPYTKNISSSLIRKKLIRES